MRPDLSPGGFGPGKSLPCRLRTPGIGSYCGSAAVPPHPEPPPPPRCSRPGGSGRPAPAGLWPAAPRCNPCGGRYSHRTGGSRGNPAPGGGERRLSMPPPCQRRFFSAPSSPGCRTPRPLWHRGRIPPARRYGRCPGPRWSTPEFQRCKLDFLPGMSWRLSFQ